MPDGRDPRCYHTGHAEDRGARMKGWHVALIAVFSIIIIAGVVFGFYRHSAETSPVEKLRGAIESANYCAIDSDCSPLGPVCPFGCGLVVNRNERQRILDEIRAAPVKFGCYQKMYKCRNDLPVCTDGKCRYGK